MRRPPLLPLLLMVVAVLLCAVRLTDRVDLALTIRSPTGDATLSGRGTITLPGLRVGVSVDLPLSPADGMLS